MLKPDPKSSKGANPKATRTATSQTEPPIEPQQLRGPFPLKHHGGKASFHQAYNPAVPQQPFTQYSHPPTAIAYPVIYVNPIPANAQDSPMFTSGRSKTDEENGAEYNPEWSKFSEKEVRKTFIRKVYFILLVQLLFTLDIICLFIFEPHIRGFIRRNSIVYYISLAVFFGVYIAMACSGGLRRKYPTNIILLSIFTVAVSFMMGTLSSYFKTETVAMAVGICAAVCLTVTLFSFYTKFDFTSCGGVLCILLIILLVFGIIAIFVRSKLMVMIYAGLGAILFIMYLAYDTQLLMEGKHVQLSPEEYIFAAIHLYIDIVYIFMFLLMLIGMDNN